MNISHRAKNLLFPRSPRFQASSRLHDCSGVALLEFTIGLFAVLVLIFGMVDGWKLLFEAQTITTASEHGARTAGAVAHQLELNRDLGHACSDVGGVSAVLSTAVNLTFRYLVATGLEKGVCNPSGSPVRSCVGENFTISAQFSTLCEDSTAQRAVELSIQANSNAHCLFCLLPSLMNIPMNALSTFPVEAECDLLGSVTC